MAYTDTAFVALVILVIINYDIFIHRKENVKNRIPAIKSYRRFLWSVLVFYVCDTLWGFFYDHGLIKATYVDTMIFFMVMALSVFLWTRYVIAYLKEKTVFTAILHYTGWFFLFFEWIIVIVNIFTPVLFYFNENNEYTAGRERYINLIIQLLMFLITSIYMFAYFIKRKGRARYRYMTIGFFGFVMAVFVFVQMLYPFLAMYSVGYMIGTCLLHTFVLEDAKKEHFKELNDLLERERLQRLELGTAKQKAYTDSLTGVRNKHAYAEAEADINDRIKMGYPREIGVIVFDLNGLKKINDSRGHEEGDRYIKTGCHMICRWFKHSPIFRVGGDEFVAILEGDDYDERIQLLHDFDKIIEENIKTDNVVISTGLDIFNKENDRLLEDVFKRADKKMYERKAELKAMGSI